MRILPRDHRLQYLAQMSDVFYNRDYAERARMSTESTYRALRVLMRDGYIERIRLGLWRKTEKCYCAEKWLAAHSTTR
jgi:DNA-binding IclR family transcriptional regulator